MSRALLVLFAALSVEVSGLRLAVPLRLAVAARTGTAIQRPLAARTPCAPRLMAGEDKPSDKKEEEEGWTIDKARAAARDGIEPASGSPLQRPSLASTSSERAQ